MIAPAEISRKTFETTRHGYDENQVDTFLRTLGNDYTKLYNENADLIKKLGMLVEKIEDYRKDEEYIKSAVISMQKATDVAERDAKQKAEEIIAEASVKADEVLVAATREAESLKSDAQNLYDIEKEKIDSSLKVHREMLEAMKTEVSDFKTRMFALYKEHFDQINAIPNHAEEQKEEDFHQMVKDSEETASVPMVVETETEAAAGVEPLIEPLEPLKPVSAAPAVDDTAVLGDTAEIEVQVADSTEDDGY